jgi:hypothetical protein
VTVAVIILVVPAASIASSGGHLYRINPQRGRPKEIHAVSFNAGRVISVLERLP